MTWTTAEHDTVGRAEELDLASRRAAAPVGGSCWRTSPALVFDATTAEGLAVRGEEVADAGAAVDEWLGRTGLAQA